MPSLETELAQLPRLGSMRLPLAIPRLLAAGRPAVGYPFPWIVCTWMAGEPATPERLRDPRQTTRELADVIRALQAADTAGGPPARGRGGPLAPRDAAMRRAVDTMGARVDRTRVLALWEDALAAAPWTARGVWLHGDLDARNVLARDGGIAAVIDWGSCAVGDPACDVMVAWKMVPSSLRAAFREALAVDDATWRRARGWALSQALIALAYYTRENNAVLVDEAWRWLGEVLME
jgi:aminoglycoside phosphotransferase (APT) family kinase protein